MLVDGMLQRFLEEWLGQRIAAHDAVERHHRCRWNMARVVQETARHKPDCAGPPATGRLFGGDRQIRRGGINRYRPLNAVFEQFLR
jgi:hypothetical protein